MLVAPLINCTTINKENATVGSLFLGERLPFGIML